MEGSKYSMLQFVQQINIKFWPIKWANLLSNPSRWFTRYFVFVFKNSPSIPDPVCSNGMSFSSMYFSFLKSSLPCVFLFFLCAFLLSTACLYLNLSERYCTLFFSLSVTLYFYVLFLSPIHSLIFNISFSWLLYYIYFKFCLHIVWYLKQYGMVLFLFLLLFSLIAFYAI